MRDIENDDHVALAARRRANRRQSTRRRSSTAEKMKASIGSFRAWMTSHSNLDVEPRYLSEDEEEEILSLGGKDDGPKERKLLRRPSGGENLLAMLGGAIPEDDEEYTLRDDSDSEYETDEEVLQDLIQFMPTQLNELLQVEQIGAHKLTDNVLLLSVDIDPSNVGKRSNTPRPTGSGKRPRQRKSISARNAPIPSSSLRSKSTSKRSGVRSHRSSDSMPEQRRERRSSRVGRRLDTSISGSSTRRQSSLSAHIRSEPKEKRSEDKERPLVPVDKEKHSFKEVAPEEEKGQVESQKERRPEETGSRRPRRGSVSKAASGLDETQQRSRDRSKSKKPKEGRSTRSSRSSSVTPASSSSNRKSKRESRMSVSCSARETSSRRSSSSAARRPRLNSSLRAPTTPQVGRKQNVEASMAMLSPPTLNRESSKQSRESSRQSRRKTTSEVHKSRRREKAEANNSVRRFNTIGATAKSPHRGDKKLTLPRRQESFVQDGHCEDENPVVVEALQLVLKSLPDGSSHTVACERGCFPNHSDHRSERRRNLDVERELARLESSQSSHASFGGSDSFSNTMRSQRQSLLFRPYAEDANVFSNPPIVF
ncbi:expressed unknown protein [Seminavis robusta]|uniref:Uncharacterized protein n=1 Tax=Seminavis robusta TaxID=568900 RepID=A0A9N8ECX6_9STRA|nr:expressed unknown protein [Seminavis robusta]|eukprot:Sro769_g199760.1 n/a (596) ;mRNA; r:11542-13329